ncbi:MAG: segregation/condensation protein A [Candidatus Omnitrophica bacterium]|nr:segregation/condensation protein A [Candidatus Omnitrophota bacterium]
MPYKIKLEIFEGPLDLLLHLIKEEELNIYDIPIMRITEQYLEYLNLMELLDLEVAGDFLVVAATLMQIKSRMLLPPDPEAAEEEEGDPRAELVRRLLEYKTYKEVAGRLRGFEAERNRVFVRPASARENSGGKSDGAAVFGEVSLFDLISALAKVIGNLPKEVFHQVVKDEFTVAEKIHEIFHELVSRPMVRFSHFFRKAKNKAEAITTFLAILELVRLGEIMVIQPDRFGEIEIARNVRAPERQGTRAPGEV